MRSPVRGRRAMLVLAAWMIAMAQAAPAANAQRGIMIRPAILYLVPDATSAKLTNVERGMEVVVLEHSNQWAHVLAIIPQQFAQPREVSGWLLDKGIVTASTANGDQFLYGEAVNCENEASRRGGRRGADADARRLYERMAEYFPNSPLAAEAAYRAADIVWQLETTDVSSRASAHKRDPGEHAQMDEERMKKIIKKYPQTKWADLAAYHLIQNKLCGEWQQQSKCPAREAALYEKYANEHPQSPKAAEAFYNAAWRYASLTEIYPIEGQSGKVQEAANRAIAAAQKALAKNAGADWNSRAQLLIYMIQNQIPIYGNKIE
jgi:outer membrane protein assembly factor BamD (BamD/ComL family)